MKTPQPGIPLRRPEFEQANRPHLARRRRPGGATLRKVKVGHAGTLDPLASGVLVVCVGAATRLIEYVQRMPKTYRARVRLGATSDTDDADGTIAEAIDPPIPGEADLRAVLASQVGVIEQVPPEFSAIKVAGERAYDLARAGREVVLKARPVTVHRVELLDYDWPRLELEVDCGAGTYIRSIARDVGQALGCGGLIEVLTRTKIGPVTGRGTPLDPMRLDPGRDRGGGRAPRPRPATGVPGVVPGRRAHPGDRPGAGGRGRPTDAGGQRPPCSMKPGAGIVATAEAVDGGRRLAPRRVPAGGRESRLPAPIGSNRPIPRTVQRRPCRRS